MLLSIKSSPLVHPCARNSRTIRFMVTDERAAGGSVNTMHNPALWETTPGHLSMGNGLRFYFYGNVLHVYVCGCLHVLLE